MKIKLILVVLAFCFLPTLANDIEEALERNNSIQTRINNVALDLLNTNKITKRIVFAYDELDKKRILDVKDKLTKRQIIIYGDDYKFVESNDELAAMLAREISLVLKSYSGMWGGRIDSLQVWLSSKKFEIAADKRAVDFMVKANYNPLGLITYIQKTCPQKRGDKIARHNLTSRRLAIIYEYITYKYPQYLDSVEYKNNKSYQNFLLTSISNRSKLQEKIKTKSTKAVKYE